ncbi:MAG TPA: 2-oxoglutarate dehydrogenase complex dihydrolipoyllysine-residue succinyltransferase [Gammaproteobacteria bacterium]|nr:2-oxoglutarate dehydrogenase complex dihydrolipoyllysine-residue succinyltransferase [Gammaproteobacteria bacterium]
MPIDLKVPDFPESVSEGTLLRWNRKPGERVRRDDPVVDIETDKVVFEVPAPADGVLEDILAEAGTVVTAGQVIGRLREEAGAAAEPETGAVPATVATADSGGAEQAESFVLPAARRLIEEHGLDAAAIRPGGDDGRVRKEDVLRHLQQSGRPAAPAPATEPAQARAQETGPAAAVDVEGRTEKRVPMTRLRARIAERLVEAQQTAAILTTFNEINMQPVMELRARYRERFEKEFGVKLGFMSFFVRAVIEGLKRFPELNASIDGTDIVYHGFFDIGIAVSSPRGLVVPILRDADRLAMGDIEVRIDDYARKAREGKLAMEDITGGTFTLTNGGVFGSLLSTPILNPPQTGILGMHRIQERPVAENGQVVIRPMMYVALSYDHRLVDGREAVQFLVTVKDVLEDPARLVLGV